MQRQPTNRPPHAKRPWFVGISIGFTILMGAWLTSDPLHMADAVDQVRAIVGPGPVAVVESWFFQSQDTLRQAQYATTAHAGPPIVIDWTTPEPRALSPTATRPIEQPNAPIIQHPKAHVAVGSGSNTPPVLTPVRPSATPPMLRNTPTQPALQTGSASTPLAVWTPFMADRNGIPLIERRQIAPDPARPYVQAALVRIDLTRTRLHIVAGTTEPASPVQAIRPGMIPAAIAQSGMLLAAFNGGFKAANGKFGMRVDGTTFLPPRNDLATVGIFSDGRIQMGVWGQDMAMTNDLMALRQNCPLLVQYGQPTPASQRDDQALWGHAVGNTIATWRSGLGLSQDSRYLFYVVGEGLTISSLADALVSAGADRGMQLDINRLWTRFVTFDNTTGTPLHAQKLLQSMQGDTMDFLVPDTRDFFFVTAIGG